jgi:capsular polysaccharide biosynthesis protein
VRGRDRWLAPEAARGRLERLASDRVRASSAARRAGIWPGQPGWLGSALRQARTSAYKVTARAVGGTTLGRLPFRWIPSVAAVLPHPALTGHVADITTGAPASTTLFPPGPPGFESFTRSITADATSDFLALDVVVSPRTGLVWVPGGAVLGESYGSMAQLLSWGYAAHDLHAPAGGPPLDTAVPVLCVPSSAYFHLILESLPGLLRVLERGAPTDLLVWSGAPGYVRRLAALLQEGSGGHLLEAPGPIRAERVRVAGRTALSGHFDAADVGRLRALGERVAAPSRSAGTDELLFVTRAGFSRPLANEADVVEALAPHGFAPVEPASLPIPAQMALFRGARVVVGAHGGALANLAWCSPGTAVVEIVPPDRRLDCYARLSHLAGLRYRPVTTGAAGGVDLAELSSALRAVGAL